MTENKGILSTTIIRKYGYEYILVEGSDRSASEIRQPCFMGFPNMALKGCRKIGEETKKKKRKLTYAERVKILKDKDIEL